MRIIAGEWGGRPLQARPNKNLRPTSDKVREAIFSQLESKWVSDWSQTLVLDLFSGTGALALESLSRAAKKAVIVDHHLQTVRAIQKVVQEFEATDRAEILCKGALEAIRWLNTRGDKFDVIFLDPPYRQDWILATLNALHTFPILNRGGVVVAEHDKREGMTRVQATWHEESARRYGDTQVTLLTPKVI